LRLPDEDRRIASAAPGEQMFVRRNVNKPLWVPD
jgi:hypothetical protein